MDQRSSQTLIAISLSLLLATAGRGTSAEEDFQLLHQVAPTPERCCGVDSLYVCFGLLNAGNTKLKSLEEDLPLGPKGVSVEELSRACEAQGVNVLAVRTDLATLLRLRNPMILHVSQSHFIALLGCEDGKLLIFDNGTGLFECTPEFFSRVYHWQGVALILGTPSPYAVVLRYALQESISGNCLAG